MRGLHSVAPRHRSRAGQDRHGLLRDGDDGVEAGGEARLDGPQHAGATARAYVKIISDGQGPMSFSSGSGGTAALRLTAQVQGLGPRFKLKLNLQNTGSKAHPQHVEPEPQR